jgi:sortase A
MYTGSIQAYIRRWWSAALIGAGVLLCGYAALTYGWMAAQQRVLSRQWQQRNTSVLSSGRPREGLARIQIPKIGLDAVIVEGTSHSALLRGPGHVLNTALPGEPGNTVIAAHRDTFFRRLAELDPGDSVYLDGGRSQYRYVVDRATIVDPSDISVLQGSSESRLTLITCYPIRYVGPAPKRLVVRATLDDEPARTAPRSRTLQAR